MKRSGVGGRERERGNTAFVWSLEGRGEVEEAGNTSDANPWCITPPGLPRLPILHT